VFDIWPESTRVKAKYTADMISVAERCSAVRKHSAHRLRGTQSVTRHGSHVTALKYDAANQQTQFNSATPNLVYDNNGNLTSFTDGSGTTTYSWNARNQLTTISGPGLSANFVYDGLGRRASETVNSATTGYWYDGNDVLAELSGSTPTATYIRSLAIDEPFIRKGASDEFYHADALGSTLALSNAAGASTVSYSYEAFGKTTITGTSSNLFQYTGRENDGTGLSYYRERYYDARRQRFLQEDPLGLTGADINLYAYVLNNPIKFTDPLGLRVNYNSIVLGNPFVLANLERLNQAIVNQGIADDKFEIRISGGDRYKDFDGNIRSLTNDEIIKDSEPNSAHLIDNGARAVDIHDVQETGLTLGILDKALRKTEFQRCKSCKYDDRHTHLQLPNEKRYYYGFRTR